MSVNDLSLKTAVGSLFKLILEDEQFIKKPLLKLNAKDFLDEIPRNIFVAMQNIYESKTFKINHLTLINELKVVIQNTVIDINEYCEYIANEIDIHTGHEAKIDDLIKIIKDNSIKYRLNQYCKKMIDEKISLTTADYIFKDFQKNVFDVILEQTTEDNLSLEVEVNQLISNIMSSGTSKSIDKAIFSGFLGIDSYTTGIKPGELFVLAARPGIGKTTLAINIMINAMPRIIDYNNNLQEEQKLKPKKVIFFSLEMSTEQILKKMASIMTGIGDKDVYSLELSKKNDIQKQQTEIYINALKQISTWPLEIYDKSTTTLIDVENKLFNLKKENDLALIIVDYLQIIQIESKQNENRAQAVAKISKTLKVLARESDAPLIAIAQLSRKAEDRGFDNNQKSNNPLFKMQDNTPRLSDLKESGAIEQDADVVAFLHYNRKEKDVNSTTGQTKEIIDVDFIIEKNRSGRTGSSKLTFFKSTGRFIDTKR